MPVLVPVCDLVAVLVGGELRVFELVVVPLFVCVDEALGESEPV